MKTPALWKAARNGQNELVKQLLGEGADIAEKGGTTQCTPLHIAGGYGHEDTVLLLVECGAYVNVEDSFGETPLHDAAYTGHDGVVRVLLDKGADASAKDAYGRTAEEVATARSHHKVAASEIGNYLSTSVSAANATPHTVPRVGRSYEHLPHKPRTGFLVCGQAGLAINKLSFSGWIRPPPPTGRGDAPGRGTPHGQAWLTFDLDAAVVRSQP